MVQDWKIKKVDEIKNELNNWKVIGILNLDKVPASVFQKVKKKLTEVKVIVVKKAILLRTLKGTKYEPILEHLPRVPALILTNNNPFKIYGLLKKNQQDAFMKQGEISPKDVWVEEGKTSFTPGPMISEFAKIGVKTKVEEGKISVITRTKILSEGEEARSEVVGMLQTLNIKPMKQGLKLEVAQEEKTIFSEELMDLDFDEYSQKISTAHNQAINLSVESNIYNKDSITIIISKADSNAKNLGIEATVLSKDFIKDLIIKANAQSNALKKIILGE